MSSSDQEIIGRINTYKIFRGRVLYCCYLRIKLDALNVPVGPIQKIGEQGKYFNVNKFRLTESVVSDLGLNSAMANKDIFLCSAKDFNVYIQLISEVISDQEMELLERKTGQRQSRNRFLQNQQNWQKFKIFRKYFNKLRGLKLLFTSKSDIKATISTLIKDRFGVEDFPGKKILQTFQNHQDVANNPNAVLRGLQKLISSGEYITNDMVLTKILEILIVACSVGCLNINTTEMNKIINLLKKEILSSPSTCPTVDHIKSILNGSGSSLPMQSNHAVIIETFNTSAADAAAAAMPSAPNANIDLLSMPPAPPANANLPTVAATPRPSTQANLSSATASELSIVLTKEDWDELYKAMADNEEEVDPSALFNSTKSSIDEELEDELKLLMREEEASRAAAAAETPMSEIDRELKEMSLNLAEEERNIKKRADEAYAEIMAAASPVPPPPTGAPPPAIQAQNTKGFFASIFGNVFSSCRSVGGKRQTKKRQRRQYMNKRKQKYSKKKRKRKSRYSKSYKHIVKQTIKKRTKRKKNKTKKKI